MELSDMIFSIKEKLTDAEFKEIMDRLTLVNKQEDNDFYDFKCYKQKIELKKVSENSIENVLTMELKTFEKIKVKFDASCTEEMVLKAIECGKWVYMFKFEIDETKHELNIFGISRYSNCDIAHVIDTDEDSNNNLWVHYYSVIPQSLKKV